MKVRVTVEIDDEQYSTFERGRQFPAWVDDDNDRVSPQLDEALNVLEAELASEPGMAPRPSKVVEP